MAYIENGTFVIGYPHFASRQIDRQNDGFGRVLFILVYHLEGPLRRIRKNPRGERRSAIMWSQDSTRFNRRWFDDAETRT